MSLRDTDYARPPVTFEEALAIATCAFGDLGTRTLRLWREYNDRYFAGACSPVPVLYVPVSPWGHWVGLTCPVTRQAPAPPARLYLMFPGEGEERRPWSYVRGVLLHEMLHAYLLERGESPDHNGEPWRREIMRLSRELGQRIHAGAPAVGKRRTVDGDRVSVRFNRPAADGTPSLTQDEIAKWPASVGLEPPDLASETRRGKRTGRR